MRVEFYDELSFLASNLLSTKIYPMKPTHDYYYRFPAVNFGVGGRCRVRLYQRSKNAYTVVLTEPVNNSGESVAAACERIVTGLVARWKLSTRTTRWIQHLPPQDDLPAEFDELRFTWSSSKSASDPQWLPLTVEEVEELTGDDLNSLNRQIGDYASQAEETRDEPGGRG